MDISEKSSGITVRSIIISLLLIPINFYWCIIAKEPYHYQSVPISFALLYNVIFIMSMLVGLNFMLGKISRRHALNQSEMLTVYVVLSFTTAIGGMDMMQILPCMMEHAFGFATPENEWENLFHRYIPTWLSVRDTSVLEPYYEGDSSFYNMKYIKAWLKPSLIWSCFVIALVFVMMCINAIVRKSWVEHSKLSFPIIQLPLEMTDEKFSVFKSRLTWIGIAISAGIAIVNGLSRIFPAVPFLKISPWYHNFGRYFHSRPWNAMGWTPVGVIPSIVGLSFFMPLDLAFSCWFFYIFWKAQRVFFSAIGTKAMSAVQVHNIAFLNQQSFGAAMGMAAIAIWLTRNHLKRILTGMFKGQKGYDDNEPMKYSNAILGLMLGGGFLFIFSMAAGMKIWVIPAFFILYYAFAITIARIRAESGTPVHDFHATGPDQILTDAFGLRILGPRSLTVFSLFHFFNRTYRSHPMPSQIEGLRMASQTDTSLKHLYRVMMLALVIGTPIFFWVYLHISYRHQGSMLMRFAVMSYRNLETQLTYPHAFDPTVIVSVLSGFFITIGLMFMRLKFLWWNLHPVGYVISSSFSMNVCWFSIFASWLMKHIILRSGGLKMLHQSRSFFFGLILGQFFVAGFWSILGIIMGRTIYIFTW
ncbi:hypothetical protein GF312_08245 [Candidatus Poribacteria bacterium]|nr:hypothetical protein [Candidatus Poribacteria bacterium]